MSIPIDPSHIDNWGNPGHCKYCGRRVIWVTLVSGSPMPCDPGIKFGNGNRNLICPRFTDETLRRVKYWETVHGAPEEAFGRETHFATCPQKMRERGKEVVPPPPGDETPPPEFIPSILPTSGKGRPDVADVPRPPSPMSQHVSPRLEPHYTDSDERVLKALKAAGCWSGPVTNPHDPSSP